MRSTALRLWFSLVLTALMALSSTASAQINYGAYTFPDSSWFANNAVVESGPVDGWNGSFQGPFAAGTDITSWIGGYTPDVGVVNMSPSEIIDLTFITRPPTNLAGPDLVLFDAQFDASTIDIAVSTDGTTFTTYQNFGPVSSSAITPRVPGSTNVGSIPIDLDAFGLSAGVSVTLVRVRGAGQSDPFMVGVLNSNDTTPPTLTVNSPLDGAETTNNTPTISGTSEIGASIEVNILDSQNNVVQTLNATAAAGGAWSVMATQLADGSYTIETTASDFAGNTSALDTRTLTIDTTAPTLSVDTPVDGSETTDTTPTISGTSEANAEIEITIEDTTGTIQTSNVTADGTGAWALDATALPADGSYTVEVTASDALGNTSLPVTVSFELDTTSPVITLTSPVDGTLQNSPDFAVTGALDDVTGSVTIEVVDSSNTVVSSSTLAVDGTTGAFSSAIAGVSDGTYTVEITATDPLGNSSQATTTITIDTTPPSLAVSTPADMSIFAMGSGSVTGTTDAGQLVSVSILDSSMTEVLDATATADGSGAFSTMYTGLADGSYTLVVTTEDAAGNVSEVTRTFTVDTVAPTLTVVEPADMSVTNDDTPDLEVDSDPDATVEVIIYDSSANEVERVTLTGDGSGTFTGEVSATLDDAEYTAEVTSTRPNGLTLTDSVDFTVDTTAPELAITAPAEGMLTSNDTPALAGTAPAGSTVTVTVTDSMDMVVFTDDVTTDANGDWTADVDALGDGDYTVDASATDEAGNTGEATPVTFTVDTTAPTVTLDSPGMGDILDNATPTLEGTGEPGSTVTVTVDGIEVGEATVGDDGAWTFELETPLDEGEHDVEISSTDEVGNPGSTGVVTFEVDAVADLVVTSPTDGDELEGDSLTVEGTGEPGSTVTVTVGGEDVTVTVDEDGTWSLELTGLDFGSTSVNVSSGEESVDFDITLVEPADMNQVVRGGVDEGCGCSATTPADAGGSFILLLIGLVALRVQRRR